MTEDDQFIEALRTWAKTAPRIPVGTMDTLKAAPPADPEEVVATELALGFALPPLLRRVYAEVADGGVGPSGGLYPLGRGRDALASRDADRDAR